MEKRSNLRRIVEVYKKLDLYLSGGDFTETKEITGKLKDAKKFGMFGDLKVNIGRENELFSESVITCKKDELYRREKYTEEEIPLDIKEKIGKRIKLKYKESVLGVTNYLVDGIINFGFKIPMNYKKILEIKIID